MKVQTLIAGGGLAGLACARTLHEKKRPYLLVERETQVGGLCRTIVDKGFTFDYTGHFLHFHKPEVQKWVLSLLGGQLRSRTRHAVIYSQKTYSEYPYQENNAGLSTQTLRENVLGYLEALLLRRLPTDRPAADGDFHAWCLKAFGPGISKNFMFPYNEKLWKFQLKKLTTHWMGRFVPTARVREVLAGALERRSSQSGYNATFLYPDKGGISILPRALAEGLPNLWTGAGLSRLDIRRRRATLSSGLEVEYQNLVSSLPLPRLVKLSQGMPSELSRAAGQLKATSIYNINFGFKGKQPIPYSWCYFPEKEFLFHRAGSVSACVPTAVPKGSFSLYVEFSYRGNRPDPKALGRHAVQKLEQLGWIRSEKQLATRVDLDLPGAYVIYDPSRERAVPRLLSYYRQNHVFSVGRYGRWEYGSMESALDQGIAAAREILSGV